MDFATLKAKVIRMLGDIVTGGTPTSGPYVPITGTLYDADTIADGISSALTAITSRQWKNAYVDVPGDINTLSTDVPYGLIEFEGVYDNYFNQFIPRVVFAPNKTQFNTWVNGWYIYPSGTITFLNAIQAGVRISYSTYWTMPEDDTDDLETPAFCDSAIILFAASQCALAKAVQSASIRQFNMKVDSGSPEDNPLQQMSNTLLRRYEREMSLIPMMMHNIVEYRTGAGG
jgi:hypothetical protein